MSDQRLFAKYRASEIKVDLQNFELKKFKTNAIKRKNALRKIIANLTLGNYNEMSYLFPEILKYWQVEDDMEVKRICHEYVRKLGPSKPKNTEDSLSHILNDLKSGNQNLQIMALKTLIMVPSPAFIDEAFVFVRSLINCQSLSLISISKAAIYSLNQLEELDHDRALPLMDVLIDIVENNVTEPTLKVAALNTLYCIHERNLKMDNFHLSVDVSFDILKLLPKLNEWDKALVFESLTGIVVPQTHDDAHDLIDITEPQLQHVNTFVALNALKFIIYLINYVDYITETLSKKLSSSIIALLTKPPQLQFLVLRNVILLLLSREVSILNLDVSYFFVEYNDPIYIKDTKLECLYLLANKDNLYQILEELEEYATNIDIQMSRKAIRAVGNLAVKLNEESANECVLTLLSLLEFGVDYVVQEIISVFRNILRKYPDRYQSHIRNLVNYTDSVQESESKNAMIWIITNYTNILPNYLEVFKVFSSNILEETMEVQFSILTSSIKFFIRSPSKKTEELCMQILKCCTEDIDNPDIRGRALMYWRLLTLAHAKHGKNISHETIKEIVDGELPIIELNTKLDPVILEELELNIGSIASIYLKPVSQIFRLNKTKFLPQSSVFSGDKNTLNVVGDNSCNFNNSSNDILNSCSGSRQLSEHRPLSITPRRNTIMGDYDKPAETVNQLKGEMKSSFSISSKLSKKPSKLMRKLTLKKSF